jgi:hypothetical protein
MYVCVDIYYDLYVYMCRYLRLEWKSKKKDQPEIKFDSKSIPCINCCANVSKK